MASEEVFVEVAHSCWSRKFSQSLNNITVDGNLIEVDQDLINLVYQAQRLRVITDWRTKSDEI